MSGHLSPGGGGVDHCLVLLEEADRLLRFAGLDVDGLGACRMHHARDELQVVDLVHAGVHTLEGVHRCGDVAGDRHAQTVRLGADRLDDVGLQQGVQLDLLEAGGMVPVHDCRGFLGSFYVHRAERCGAAAIDEASEQQPGAEAVLCVDGLSHRGQELKLSAAVAGCCHSGGQECGAELDAGVVGVHLPEPGQQVHSFLMQHANVRRQSDLVCCACCDYAAVADDYRGVRYGGTTCAIDEGRADDGKASRCLGRDLLVELREVFHLLSDAAVHELIEGGFVLVVDDLHGQAAGEGNDRGKLVVLVEPEDLAAKHEVRDGVSLEAHGAAGERKVILSGEFDFDGRGQWVGAQNGQSRGLMVGLPVAHHHHLFRHGRCAEQNERGLRQGHGSVLLTLVDGGGAAADLGDLRGCRACAAGAFLFEP